MLEQPGLHVLVVTEHQEFADKLARILRILGHEVDLTRGGSEALEAVQTEQPHVVFLELRPQLEAFWLAQHIQEQATWRKPFLVAVAGKDSPEARRRARAAGIDLFLVKPIDLDKLHSLLRRFESFVLDVERFDPVF